MNRIITKLNCAKYCGIRNWLCLLTTQLYILHLRIFGLYACVRRDFQGHKNLSKYARRPSHSSSELDASFEITLPIVRPRMAYKQT